MVQGLKWLQGVLQGLESHQIPNKPCVCTFIHRTLGSQRLRTAEGASLAAHLPANARDMGLISDLGRSHMPE